MAVHFFGQKGSPVIASDGNDITRTHATLTKDSLVGYYRIVDKIGAGGIGEALAAAEHDHPKIITFHEVGENNDRPFFAHLVDGLSKAPSLGAATGTTRSGRLN